MHSCREIHVESYKKWSHETVHELMPFFNIFQVTVNNTNDGRTSKNSEYRYDKKVVIDT